MTEEAEQMSPSPPPDNSGLAVVSGVLGGFNLVLWCCPVVCVVTAPVAIVFGLRGLQSQSRGMAIAGIACSVAALILTAGISAVAVRAIQYELRIQENSGGNRPPFVDD